MAEGLPKRPAWAQFDQDGRYEARSFSKAGGIMPGTYEVQIDCWKTLPDEATGRPGQSYVPKDWVAELVVPSDSSGPIVADYDVTP
ncbi:hypothetical protein NG895_23845 [Aeoliella sp. ICT_H6.2]|uniref:Uncharacterized protein n=1 Tax=Aeoliella straminimaris TaxID=2954799 RepID=A0A9X2FE32_9BACT|nr:hypothetical protein [Aeoliella straminimaris]MCO6046944.1 hypothetical protein [Aeoliella straminimaris]